MYAITKPNELNTYSVWAIRWQGWLFTLSFFYNLREGRSMRLIDSWADMILRMAPVDTKIEETEKSNVSTMIRSLRDHSCIEDHKLRGM